MRRPILVTVLALLTGPPAGAQTPGDTVRLTLDAAVRRALEQSEEIRLARAQVMDANGRVREALSGALPQVTGSLAYTRQFASIYQGATEDTSAIAKLFKNSPFGAPNAWSFQIEATQLLWSGGKVGAGLSAARSLRQSVQLDEQETGADVAFRVKQAYLNAAYSAQLLAIAQENLAQARDHLREVQLYQRAGTRAEYDLLRAQVDAANQEPAVVAARNSYELGLLELKRLVNVPAGQALELDTPLESPDATIPVLATDSLGGPERAGLAAAEATVNVQQQLLRAARADRWPTLSLATTYTEQAFPSNVFPATDQFRRGWNGELKLSFPIFLGFKTAGTIERARAALLSAQARRDQAREQVQLEVAQAKAEVERARALLVARRETVRQAKRAHYLAGVRYANGMATQLEVSDGRVLTQQAEVNQVQATRDYLLALAQLERALGRPVPVVRRSVEQVATGHNSGDTQP
jgi:outer membrane protein TolC